MNTNKIIILILSTKDSKYDNFIKSCTEGWVKKARDNGIRCIFYSGGAQKNLLENDNLLLDCDDSLAGTALKLFKALQFIECNKIYYTHIYRTNLSSFIFIDSFIKYSQNLKDDIYAGVIGSFNKVYLFNRFHLLSTFASKFLPFQVLKFASGSGFFLSRNYVLKLLDTDKINFNYIDDVMVGSVLDGIRIFPIPRYDIVNNLPSKYESNCFHVRLKSSDRLIDSNRLALLCNFNSLEDLIESGKECLES
jgi:hypothetical protein